MLGVVSSCINPDYVYRVYIFNTQNIKISISLSKYVPPVPGISSWLTILHTETS